MANSIDILKEIRRDFAEITGILLYLQNLRRFSENSKKAIDGALQSFSFIVVQYIGEIRKSFGDPLWYRLEDIDMPEMDKEKYESRYGIHAASIVEQIKIKAKDLNTKLLTLPGDDKCGDEQSEKIARLFEGLGIWRSNELNEIVRAFG